MFPLQTSDKVGRLLDLCVKFFQEFVTWKISQDERFAARSKPEPVERECLIVSGWVQDSCGVARAERFKALRVTIHKIHAERRPIVIRATHAGFKTHARVMNVNSFSGLQFYKI